MPFYRICALLCCLSFFILPACDDVSSSAVDLPDRKMQAKKTTELKKKEDVESKTNTTPKSSEKTLKLDKTQIDARLKAAFAQMSKPQKAAYVSCMKKKGPSCYILGDLFLKQARTLKDAKRDDAWRKVLLAFKRGCKGDHMPSCMKLGQIYAEGEAIAKNDIVASYLYKKACDRQHDPGCLALAKMQKEGRAGTVKAGSEVIKAETKSCDKNLAQACARLGSRYEDGLNVKRNKTLAAMYFERACKLNHALSCHAIGVKLMKAGNNDKRAIELFDKACAAKFSQSCYNAAYMMASNRGRKKDVEQMRKWLTIGCDRGYKAACAQLSQLKKAP